MLDAKLAYVIIGTVSAAWLTLTIASIVTPIQVPEALNGLFLAVAGAAIAKLDSGRQEKKQDQKEDDQP